MPLHKITLGSSQSLATYTFTVIFDPGAACSLFLLRAKSSESTIWHDIITKNETDNDGDISIEIGTIRGGTIINLEYGIYAIDALSGVRFIITNTSTGDSLQIDPEDAEESLSVKKNDSYIKPNSFTA